MELIKPKEITVKTMDGESRQYTISRIPAIPAREIVTQYPISAIPKIGEYKINEEMMLKIMSYVAVTTQSGNVLVLSTKELINNHVPDWESLAGIEIEMIRYNTSFFDSGKISGFFEGFVQNVQASISKMLTDLLAQSSKSDKQDSGN